MTSANLRNSALRRFFCSLLIVLLFSALLFGSRAAAAEDDSHVGRTPPRLSLVDGQVSFWRPKAGDWTPAQLNIALAPDDMLATGPGARLELQVGAHAFVRAGADTELGLVNQEPDFLQFKLTNGRITLDLRQLGRGHSVEVDTPNAAFTFDRAGYYRVDAADERTTLVTRRGGRAVLTPAGGQAIDIEANEETVIEGAETPRVATNRAPGLDDWDRWNYDRTDTLLNANSDRYVSPDMYGTADLDSNGRWEVVPTYGRVWVPANVAADWAPYSTGRWMNDPYYGWTWVDNAAWGWAPYHYGRWVYANSYWAWAPGPIAVAVAPVYSPALVAFFGPTVSVSIGFPFVSWVALGWGEPLWPWWGGVAFIGHPWWGGWCGPHWHGDHGHDGHHNHWNQNVGVHNAVVTVRREQFHGATVTRVNGVRPHDLRPVHGALPIKPGAVTAGRANSHGFRPSTSLVTRPVVTAHPGGRGSIGGSQPANQHAIAPRAMPAVRDSLNTPPATRSEMSRTNNWRSAPQPPHFAETRGAVTSSPNPSRSNDPSARSHRSDVSSARPAPDRFRENQPASQPPAPRFSSRGTFSTPSGPTHVDRPAEGSSARPAPHMFRENQPAPPAPRVTNRGTFSSPSAPTHFNRPAAQPVAPRMPAQAAAPRMQAQQYSPAVRTGGGAHIAGQPQASHGGQGVHGGGGGGGGGHMGR